MAVERAASIASSSTETVTSEEQQARLAGLEAQEKGTAITSPDFEDNHYQDEVDEKENLLPQEAPKPIENPKTKLRSAITWMAVNTLATIGIVFTNKAIFSDPTLKLCQLTFASFHFFITWVTLHILSREPFGYFVPRRAAIKTMLPLAVSMCLNVILPNLSLAFSSVTFYQIARILLTPTVALMNFILYKATLPRAAILALIPACAGVGLVSYYDSLPAADATVKTTSPIGVIFAFMGIFASSLYTIWIASYHRKLEMSSMQLLHNQAPISAFLLLYVIPFVDYFPTWSEVPLPRWILILISGVCASLINISQFFIVAQTGPVSSTVVGHVKTCTIVALGWFTSGRAIGDKSVLGVMVALGGIMAYSYIMLKKREVK